MNTINNVSNPASAVETPVLNLKRPESESSVQFLVAQALAQAFALDNRSRPSQDQQLLDAIEQALADAAHNAKSVIDAIKFWKSLAGTLSEGSPLNVFAVSQLKILESNPELIQWENQVAKDQTDYAQAYSNDQNIQAQINVVELQIEYCKAHWYNPACLAQLVGLGIELGALKLAKVIVDNTQLAPALQKLQQDVPILNALEAQALKRSNFADTELGQTAQSALYMASSQDKHLIGFLDQLVGLQKILIGMDQVQS